MERGSAKHDPRMDEALTEQLRVSSARTARTVRNGPRPSRPPTTTRRSGRTSPAADPGEEIDQDEAEMLRLRHAMEVANDWNPARDRS